MTTFIHSCISPHVCDSALYCSVFAVCLQCVCSVLQRIHINDDDYPLVYQSAMSVTPPCIAMCCSVLQCLAVYCSMLQCIAVCCSALQCAAVCCSVLQCVAVCCSVLQCVAVCCSVLQCIHINDDVYPLVHQSACL